MKKRFNLMYVFISIIPVVVLLISYSSLNSLVNTKIFGENGFTVSKFYFVWIIILLSCLWYYLSFLFSKKLSIFKPLIDQKISRTLINLFFSILSILLIISN